MWLRTWSGRIKSFGSSRSMLLLIDWSRSRSDMSRCRDDGMTKRFAFHLNVQKREKEEDFFLEFVHSSSIPSLFGGSEGSLSCSTFAQSITFSSVWKTCSSLHPLGTTDPTKQHYTSPSSPPKSRETVTEQNKELEKRADTRDHEPPVSSFKLLIRVEDAVRMKEHFHTEWMLHPLSVGLFEGREKGRQMQKKVASFPAASRAQASTFTSLLLCAVADWCFFYSMGWCRHRQTKAMIRPTISYPWIPHFDRKENTSPPSYFLVTSHKSISLFSVAKAVLSAKTH